MAQAAGEDGCKGRLAVLLDGWTTSPVKKRVATPAGRLTWLACHPGIMMHKQRQLRQAPTSLEKSEPLTEAPTNQPTHLEEVGQVHGHRVVAPLAGVRVQVRPAGPVARTGASQGG